MTVFDDLRQLSAAEDFFAYLDVAFDPRILAVARLHILRRMGQYLAESDARGAFDGLSDRDIHARCHDHLAKAYQDFVLSSPLAERLFKVHRDAVAPKRDAGQLVQLSTLE
ncbi:MAG: nitrogenase stabilizing/protective protein NifW [Telmatospirillum sp.]|nr:nitrogenase stabilizing/protective protein NifW [Telmatospirillum sp.]